MMVTSSNRPAKLFWAHPRRAKKLRVPRREAANLDLFMVFSAKGFAMSASL
jgi:hypothetical protein